jgi:hypothetical protein
MSTWNKETQLVSMYFSECFIENVPLNRTSVRDIVEEQIMYNQEGIAREFLLTVMNRVDWYDIASTYNEDIESDVLLFDEC